MSAEALTLFDLDTPAAPLTRQRRPALTVVRGAVDWDALEQYALLYTASEKGSNSGIRFAMTVEDAQTWCSSDVSSGQLHGTRWAYMWTSVANFIRCHWGPKEPKLVTTKLVDNGQWDARIAALGLTKIAIADFPAVFGPLGVEVVT